MFKNEELTVKLSRDQIDWLIRETKKGFPLEICGALFGYIINGGFLIKKIIQLRNVLNSPVAFQIDPGEFLVELIKAEKEGLKHVGFFHSHLRPAKPSLVDIKFMRLWPETIWLIVSLINYRIAAYRIVNDKVHNIYVEIV